MPQAGRSGSAASLQVALPFSSVLHALHTEPCLTLPDRALTCYFLPPPHAAAAAAAVIPMSVFSAQPLTRSWHSWHTLKAQTHCPT